MNKKGAGALIGLGTIIGGIAFIWLLITLFSSGAIIGFAGNKGLVMFIIFIIILWIITRKK